MRASYRPRKSDLQPRESANFFHQARESALECGREVDRIMPHRRRRCPADILRLLLLQFSRPIIVANLIAWPVSFYLMRDWLQGFAYRIDMTILPYAGAAILVLLIAWATVGGHAWRVARTNPIHALRYE